jgi:hypothetical protein
MASVSNFFYTIHVSVTRHFLLVKACFEDTVSISTIIFLYKLLSISKPNTSAVRGGAVS